MQTQQEQENIMNHHAATGKFGEPFHFDSEEMNRAAEYQQLVASSEKNEVSKTFQEIHALLSKALNELPYDMTRLLIADVREDLEILEDDIVLAEEASARDFFGHIAAGNEAFNSSKW